MFKKKPPVEQPRTRQRVSDMNSSQQRNTAVFSYHANRSTSLETRGRMTPEEQQPKRSKAPRRILSKITPKHALGGLVGLLIAMLCMGLSSTPKIVVLGNGSNQFALQSLSVYQQAAHVAFGKSLTNNNKLTINTDAVAAELQGKFPELHAVSISLPFLGRQPTVYIQPAVPQMVFSTSSGQFILDSNGRALADYTSRTELPSDRSVPIVTDQSGIAAQKGAVVLPSQSVHFITEVAAQLYAKQIKVDTWTLPAAGSELDVKVSGAPYFVKFNLQANAREEAGTFLATKNYLDNQHKTPNTYIDARVTGRAYYK
jgi:hypothetical protein